jgi:hypothetical protein
MCWADLRKRNWHACHDSSGRAISLVDHLCERAADLGVEDCADVATEKHTYANDVDTPRAADTAVMAAWAGMGPDPDAPASGRPDFRRRR